MFYFAVMREFQSMQYVVHQDWSYVPDSKIHGANMGPIWGQQDPGGPHVGPINFVIWCVFGSNL